MRSFIFHKKTFLASVGTVFVVLAFFFGQLLSTAPLVQATSLSITNGSFGAGEDEADIAFWEEKGNEPDNSTIAKKATTGDESISPEGGRFARIDRFNNGNDGDGSICQEVNATGYESLALGYYWRGDHDAEDGSDRGVVEYLLNGSCESADNQWTTITSHELNDGNQETTSWSTLQSLALPSVLNNKSFFLRFRGDVDSSGEVFRVDGVSLQGTLIVTDVCPNIDGTQETVPSGYTLNEGMCTPVEQPGATITINATKIVCDNESDLPDWSDGQMMFSGITATTASDFLASKEGACRVASDWGFSWAYPGVGNPGSETVGVGGPGWHAFDTTTNEAGVATTTITLTPGTKELWVREQFQEGYIPFADTKGTSAVSAELYCHHNVVNFDNYDYITKNRTDQEPFTTGGVFHCIAFNVPTTPAPVCTPEENLLKNGGFETPDVSSGGYSIFPQGTTGLEWLVDWVSAQVSGIKGLEIQDHAAGDPAEGSQLAELDGNHPVKIWQDVPTIPGKEYKLTFKYSPRAGRTASDNSIKVKIDGSDLGATLATDGSSNSNTVWESITRSFVATGTTTKVEFFDDGDDTSYGGYLDDVVLSCVGDPTPHCDEGSSWDAEKKQCVPNDTTSDVTMCKIDANGTKLSGWTLMLLKGAKVDSVTVPANDVDGVESNVSLNGDTPYVALASGTWLNDRGEQNLVDAEYSTVNGWATAMDGYTGYGADILELKINNVLGAWGPLNTLHTYAQSFTMASAGKAVLGIEDSYHGDNKGELTVDIYEGYSGVTGENGCFTIENVPFGSYTVSEMNQVGWTAVDIDETKTINQPQQEITVENHFDYCPEKEGVQASTKDCGGEETPTYACSDNADNDEDGLIDEDDPACHSDHDVNNPESYTPNADSEVYEGAQCSDGKENDSDGLIDSNDPGCHTDGNATDNDDTYNPDDNEESNGSNRSGSIPSGGSVLGAFIGPAVLGDNMCGEYITDYIKLGAKNDPANVSRLQTFLNEYLGLSLKVDGHYGPRTFEAVKQFQIKEAGEVLSPWIGVTLKDKVATGWVYKTTRRWINMIKCPELNIPQFEKAELVVR